MTSRSRAALHRPARVFAVAAAMVGASVLAGACGDDDADAAGRIRFADEVELFPNFSFDTGLQPSGSKVQASFSVAAEGSSTVVAAAIVSGSSGAPTVSGLPGEGKLDLSGRFALEGRLSVDISGLSYDGPIPGLSDVEIPFQGKQSFDPFSIDEEVTAQADIPPTRLPAIPLPGGLPGSLVLEVVEGSFVGVAFTGTSVCADKTEAQYRGALSRSGTLVLRPSVELKVPVVGTQTFTIPDITVPLSLGGSDLSMAASISSLGSKPAQGDHFEVACSESGGGGGGAGGNGSTSTSSSTTTGGGPQHCGFEASANACRQCCVDDNATSWEMLNAYAVQECACMPSAPCEPQCYDACYFGEETPDACVSCIEKEFQTAGAACVTAGIQRCYDNGDCSEVIDCMRDEECSALP